MAAKQLMLAAVLSFSTREAYSAPVVLHGSAVTYANEERRMRDEHEASVASLESSMTMRTAFGIFRTSANATPSLLSLVQGAVYPSNKKHQFLGFVQQGANPKGYAGLDKARDLLNDMLNEVNHKHDVETQKCKSFFEKQCSLMETVRQDISAANAAAADARSRVLSAQTEINVCEVELPRLRYSLQEHERMCKEEIADLEASIKIVLADIEVMERVLEMTDCEGKDDSGAASFLQKPKAKVMKCKCEGKDVLVFKHGTLQKNLAQLKSPELRKRVLANLQTLAAQDPSTSLGFEVLANVTNFTNPEVPHTEVPPNPCEGITFDDAATDGDKCSLSTNPLCYKLQDKFLAIQAGIEDLRDELLAKLEETTVRCRMVKETLEAQIDSYETRMSKAQMLLAESTAQENDAGEEGRMKGEEHDELSKEMFSTRDECSTNLRTFESEVCALKKIRGELYKMQGENHTAFFQDCEVSDWEAEECSAECGGGEQKLVRSVTVQPYKGAACPPLEAKKQCNLDPCPIDCEIEAWTGWGSCSAQCDGGVQTRTRGVKVQPKHGGKPCPEVSETVSCNTQACAKDCVLEDWTPWSNCSKVCDGGSQTRTRRVLEEAVGAGKCAEEKSEERFAEQRCNEIGCPKPRGLDEPLQCHSKVDIILLLDGSGSIGSEGWEQTKKFADKFLSSFEGNGADANVATILFSGPRTWSAYFQCVGTISPHVDMENTCGIKIAQHFTTDVATAKQTIAGLSWPSGTTLTSVALETAHSLVSTSRPGVETVVVVITDGVPLSELKTRAAAEKTKSDSVRLLMVPVLGRGLPQSGELLMRDMASDPKDSNMLTIEDFSELDSTATIDHLVADMCEEIY